MNIPIDSVRIHNGCLFVFFFFSFSMVDVLCGVIIDKSKLYDKVVEDVEGNLNEQRWTQKKKLLI